MDSPEAIRVIICNFIETNPFNIPGFDIIQILIVWSFDILDLHL